MAPSPGRKKWFALFYMCHIPFVKSLDVPTDFLVDRHTWSPHGKRKRRSAKLPTSGKRTSWLRGEQEAGVPASVDTHPVVQWRGGPFRDVRNIQRALVNIHKKNALVHKRYTARLNVCMSTRSPSSSWRWWSAKSPCLPPPDLQSPQQCASRDNLSSPPKLSLVYSEPSISASERCHPLRSANYAILSAEAPPKLPFCYNQTPSQSDNVPATPTCHRHSQPRDNLLGSRNMTRFGPKWDIHHVIESKKLTTFYKIIYNFTSWMLKLADI